MIALHIIVFLVIATVMYRHFLKTMQLQAGYRLYAVRDDLIQLVADEKLDEDNEIFQYYYERINLLLAKAPNVGLDDLMHALIKWEDNEQFRSAMKRAIHEAKKIRSMPELENPEVCRVVEQYYSSRNSFILSHSSILRIVNLIAEYYAKTVSRQASRKIAGWIIDSVGGAHYHAWAVAQYSQHNAAKLHCNVTGCTT